MTNVSGTPSSLPPVADDATLAALDVARALEVVAARAVSPLGAARVRARRPVGEADACRAALTPVAELAGLLRAGDPFRPEPVPDLGETLTLLRQEGVPLPAEALVALGTALGAMRTTARGLEGMREAAPAAAGFAVPVPPSDLARAIAAALDEDGTVRDGADRDVDRARREVRRVRADLLGLLERTVRGLAAHEAPPDAAPTLRGGRYVIPLLRDARGRVPGLVHGESASGATLFVEPQAAVEMGNDLAAAEAAEQRAVLALYRQLTDRARPHLEEIRAGYEMCIAADDLYARARYAADVDAVLPRLEAPPAAQCLRGARHPLLLADGVEAVPFDLVLDATQTAVIVSGPNTGGKTVLLKGVGLISVLVQSGILPPLAPESALPVFGRIVADIGDHQSIAASLSTFSAHLGALRAALDVAGPATLVLLDEVGTGTDPREGAALAGAAILTLVECGARVVATTHLGEMKQLATEHDGIVNASLQFDAEGLRPTYRLLQGVPGRSYGLVMAQRLGLPSAVLRRAEGRVAPEERALDAALADAEARARSLEERAGALDAAEARARRDTEALAALRRELEQEAGRLAQRERELEREGREQARAFLLQARKRVEEALGMARAAVDEATAREARRLVEQGIREEADELTRLKDALAEKGWRIRGEDLRERSPRPERGADPADEAGSAVHRSLIAAPAEIDLRGQRADEARVAVAQAIDAAVVQDLPALRIIHGKGGGVLRQVVAEVVARDRRVKDHRLAPPEQGGAGVTIVELA